jgi:DNA repair exonuclease SbcCD ATPase subunit
MRIDLSLLFAWRQIAKMKNSTNTNLLILDETFDSSLDEEGVDNLMKILFSLDKGTNTFIISHKPDILESKLQEKITFTKVNNFSAIA